LGVEDLPAPAHEYFEVDTRRCEIPPSAAVDPLSTAEIILKWINEWADAEPEQRPNRLPVGVSRRSSVMWCRRRILEPSLLHVVRTIAGGPDRGMSSIVGLGARGDAEKGGENEDEAEWGWVHGILFCGGEY
jgi:hypothetical protein